MKSTHLLWLAAWLLGGCASPLAPRPLVTAHGNVRVAAAAPGRYALQALRQAYTYDHLHHVAVYLLNVTDSGDYEQNNTNPGELLVGSLVPNGLTDNAHPLAIALTNLKAQKQYKVRLEAYQVDPANGEGSEPVRVDDHSDANITAFNTLAIDSAGTIQDDVGGLTFGLVLADQTFDGHASGGVAVTDGSLRAGDAPLTISLPEG